MHPRARARARTRKNVKKKKKKNRKEERKKPKTIKKKNYTAPSVGVHRRLHSYKRIVQYFPRGTGGIISSCFIY